jgi:hypothetical protein
MSRRKRERPDTLAQLEDNPTLSDVDSSIFGVPNAFGAASLRATGEDGAFMFGRTRLETTALVLPEDATEQEYEQIGRLLLSMNKRLQWLIGDWLSYGENRKWGQTYQVVALEFGYEVSTLWTYASVCRSVKPLTRVKELSFDHHRAVASMPEEEQQVWLRRAQQNGWSAAELRRRIKDVPDVTPSPSPVQRSLLMAEQRRQLIRSEAAKGNRDFWLQHVQEEIDTLRKLYEELEQMAED